MMGLVCVLHTGPERQQAYLGNAASIERILQFGRDLHTMGEQLKKEHGTNEANKKALKVCRCRFDYV